jgi:hypothetical protein
MVFRIYRMKDGPREQFRWAAHTGGPAMVKPKDYEATGEIEAASPYAAWKALAANGDPLHTGDLLEEIATDASGSALHIAKYVGIEKATWLVPEPKPEIQPSSPL